MFNVFSRTTIKLALFSGFDFIHTGVSRTRTNVCLAHAMRSTTQLRIIFLLRAMGSRSLLSLSTWKVSHLLFFSKIEHALAYYYYTIKLPGCTRKNVQTKVKFDMHRKTMPDLHFCFQLIYYLYIEHTEKFMIYNHEILKHENIIWFLLTWFIRKEII